jgi:PAS domain-containing protein
LGRHRGIPLWDEEGRPRGYWGTETDVTDRRRNEERLARLLEENQAAARRYAALIKASNTGAWEYDVAAQRMWCSPEYFTLLGHDPAAFAAPEKQTLAACWLDLIHPGDRDAANGYWTNYLRQPDRPFDLRFRMRRRDGAWAWIWSRGQMLPDAAAGRRACSWAPTST